MQAPIPPPSRKKIGKKPRKRQAPSGVKSSPTVAARSRAADGASGSDGDEVHIEMRDLKVVAASTA